MRVMWLSPLGEPDTLAADRLNVQANTFVYVFALLSRAWLGGVKSYFDEI